MSRNDISIPEISVEEAARYKVACEKTRELLIKKGEEELLPMLGLEGVDDA